MRAVGYVLGRWSWRRRVGLVALALMAAGSVSDLYSARQRVWWRYRREHGVRDAWPCAELRTMEPDKYQMGASATVTIEHGIAQCN